MLRKGFVRGFVRVNSELNGFGGGWRSLHEWQCHFSRERIGWNSCSSASSCLFSTATRNRVEIVMQDDEMDDEGFATKKELRKAKMFAKRRREDGTKVRSSSGRNSPFARGVEAKALKSRKVTDSNQVKWDPVRLDAKLQHFMKGGNMEAFLQLLEDEMNIFSQSNTVIAWKIFHLRIKDLDIRDVDRWGYLMECLTERTMWQLVHGARTHLVSKTLFYIASLRYPISPEVLKTFQKRISDILVEFNAIELIFLLKAFNKLEEVIEESFLERCKSKIVEDSGRIPLKFVSEALTQLSQIKSDSVASQEFQTILNENISMRDDKPSPGRVKAFLVGCEDFGIKLEPAVKAYLISALEDVEIMDPQLVALKEKFL